MRPPIRPLADEGLIIECLLQEDVEHAEGERAVAAGSDLELAIHIGICRRDLSEHVTRNIGAPVSHAHLVGPQQRCIFDHTGQLQDRPLQVGVLGQEAAQGQAVAAAHVTEMGDPGEIVGFQGF
jgi:hypothetical protein